MMVTWMSYTQADQQHMKLLLLVIKGDIECEGQEHLIIKKNKLLNYLIIIHKLDSLNLIMSNIVIKPIIMRESFSLSLYLAQLMLVS